MDNLPNPPYRLCASACWPIVTDEPKHRLFRKEVKRHCKNACELTHLVSQGRPVDRVSGLGGAKQIFLGTTKLGGHKKTGGTDPEFPRGYGPVTRWSVIQEDSIILLLL